MGIIETLHVNIYLLVIFILIQQQNAHENTYDNMQDSVGDSGIVASGTAAICLLCNRTGSHATSRHMGNVSERWSLFKDLLL